MKYSLKVCICYCNKIGTAVWSGRDNSLSFMQSDFIFLWKAMAQSDFKLSLQTNQLCHFRRALKHQHSNSNSHSRPRHRINDFCLITVPNLLFSKAIFLLFLNFVSRTQNAWSLSHIFYNKLLYWVKSKYILFLQKINIKFLISQSNMYWVNGNSKLFSAWLWDFFWKYAW